MTAIIVEDQPPAQRILKKYIEDIGMLELKATFSNAIQAMEFLKSEPVDIIFLDIHLPKMSGIDFLKTLTNPPHVILTTAFSDYALESYEFNVVDYLLKPFSFQRFAKAVLKIPDKTVADQSGTVENLSNEIFIKTGYEHVRINTDDIFYIKSDADYTEVFVVYKKYLSSDSLKYWLKNLNKEQFVRIHKSFIVNISKIKKVSGNQVYLNEEIIIPIGRAFKENFTKRFLK